MAMSVAKGLVELKLLDKKISKAINDGVYISYKNGSNLPKGYKSIEEIEAKIKSSNQSVIDLIKRRAEIKSAIVASNATTNVEVAGKTMTVAEAIEYKNSIDYDKHLLNTYKAQFASHIRTVENHNDIVSKRADDMVIAYLGNEAKNKKDEAETLRSNFIEQNKATLIDTLDIKAQIDELENKIAEFEAEVDLVLSTSNAITHLNID